MVIRWILPAVLSLGIGCGNSSVPTGGDAPWLTGFVKSDSLNPILEPAADLTFRCPLLGRNVAWAQRNVLNPTAVVRNDSIHLLFRAQDPDGTSRIGLASSGDGTTFELSPAPVFFPAEDDMKQYEWNYQKGDDFVNPDTCLTCFFDGVEDPRIVEDEEGLYIMTYTAYDGKTARLALASSPDLRQWTKHGLVLGTGKYRDTWSKAGAIVARSEGHRMIASRIDGKFWMYYGDTDIFMATSDDLITWEAAESVESGERISVLHPRAGYFDSRLVEPGPAPLITDQGILLIYNGSNAAHFSDPALPKFTYSAGQALFDPATPYKLLDRMESYFITPDKKYERVGEVNEVCFVEGLVYFRDRWFLYYGTADSKIAVAIKH